SMSPRPPSHTHFPYTTLFRSISVTAFAVLPSPFQLQVQVRGRVFCTVFPALLPPCICFSALHPLYPSEQNLRLATLHLLRYRSRDRKSTRLNSSHVKISYAVF